MYHKIRITVVSLVVMMICVLSSTATLSYFTDTDATTNNFLIGNASTQLAIYDDVTGDTKQVLNASSYHLTDGLNIPFYLQATNDGNIPVYQRFRVVIPKALASVVTLNLPSMNDDCTIDTSITTGTSSCSNDDYIVVYNPAVEVEETVKYAEYYIISKEPLAKDEVTKEWPTYKVQIGNFSEVSGIDNSLFVCADQSGNNCTLGISAYSDAIQTTGFTSATQAFEGFNETY